ncbi:MAG: class I SAM-dependent methyltransferase [Deltaproteobacteria bacterium]|jgi:SAM-dependent methyltransferase|nr:class I SAM-dependent methyltransferase [Deltaproteobacteria bacterium]
MKDRLGIFLQNWRVRVVLPLLAGRVLDVGCGTNILANQYYLLTPPPTTHTPECGGLKRPKAVGVDVYPWENIDLLIESAAHLPFADDSFDTVCCVAALNHIPEREAFLREAVRLLTPQGKFIMTMLPAGISRLWHRIRKPWDADQHDRGMVEGETFGFSHKQIDAMLYRNGLRLIASARFMLGLNTLYVAIPKE